MPAFYRDTQTGFVGFWGEPTATLDWCEENYAVTKYVAEFWNSLTNYFLVIPPFLAALRCYQQNLHLGSTISFLALAVVGIGSTLFHSTLLYEMQLLDELPMIYGTCVFIYVILTCNEEKNSNMALGLQIFLFCYSIMITVIYVVVVNPLIFQWFYGLTVAALIIISGYTCRKYNGSKKLLYFGFLSYGFGFLLWNIENSFCTRVRLLRNGLPWPFDILTQLHGWWHCLAAFGTYFEIVYSIDLKMKCLKNKRKVEQVNISTNGGSCVLNVYTADKQSFSSAMFRDLWCWLPFETWRKCDRNDSLNNNLPCNGCYSM